MLRKSEKENQHGNKHYAAVYAAEQVDSDDDGIPDVYQRDGDR